MNKIPPTVSNSTPISPEEIANESSNAEDFRLENRTLIEKLGPTLLITCIVAVILIGQHYDWRIPSLGNIRGTVTLERDDWCKEHNVAESRCVECNPKLLPKMPDYGWCDEHGVHNCTLDHPDVGQLKSTVDIATLVPLKSNAAVALAAATRKENNSRCILYRSRIQFDSLEAMRQAGVDVDLVQSGSVAESISGNGEIVYDMTRTASLSPQQPGTVVLLEKNVGDAVQQGEVVAILDVKAVGEAKSLLLRALAEQKLQQLNVERLEVAKESIAMTKLLDAKAALSKATADVLSAEQLLRNLGIPLDTHRLQELDERQALESIRLAGIPESLYRKLGSKLNNTNLLPITSPTVGTAIDRSISLGEVVNASQALLRVADTSQMWLQLSVPQESVDRIKLGQEVSFLADGSKQPVVGRIDWISTSANHNTRMLQVRATIANPDGRLRNDTFGTGSIVLREVSNAVLIPTNATHWEGCCQVVFVRDKHFFDNKDSHKVFHVRSVRLGTEQHGKVEVIAGLLPGEVIATKGSDVLRAQLLKNGLGAGCCGEE